MCWTTQGWTYAIASQQLATTLMDGGDNFRLTKQLILDSARTGLSSTSCCHHCQQNGEPGHPTASLNHCVLIASFRKWLGRRLREHRHHGHAPVASLFQVDARERIFIMADSALTAEMFWGWFSGLSVLKLTQKAASTLPSLIQNAKMQYQKRNRLHNPPTQYSIILYEQ